MHRIIWIKRCNETCETFPNKIQDQKICNNMLAYFTQLLETNYITLKSLLNSDVKRRELINFTNFPLETHILYIRVA